LGARRSRVGRMAAPAHLVSKPMGFRDRASLVLERSVYCIPDELGPLTFAYSLLPIRGLRRPGELALRLNAARTTR
jgi:hypothetical protein